MRDDDRIPSAFLTPERPLRFRETSDRIKHIICSFQSHIIAIAAL